MDVPVFNLLVLFVIALVGLAAVMGRSPAPSMTIAAASATPSPSSS